MFDKERHARKTKYMATWSNKNWQKHTKNGKKKTTQYIHVRTDFNLWPSYAPHSYKKSNTVHTYKDGL